MIFFQNQSKEHFAKLLSLKEAQIFDPRHVSLLAMYNFYNVNDLLSFIDNENKLNTIAHVLEITQNHLEILLEKCRRKLEKLNLIQERCSDSFDPCASVPKEIMQKRRC